MATVRYLMDEVDASIEFYTENLGFDLQNKFGPAFAIIKKNELTVWLAGPLSSAARPMPDGASSPRRMESLCDRG